MKTKIDIEKIFDLRNDNLIYDPKFVDYLTYDRITGKLEYYHNYHKQKPKLSDLKRILKLEQ